MRSLRDGKCICSSTRPRCILGRCIFHTACKRFRKRAVERSGRGTCRRKRLLCKFGQGTFRKWRKCLCIRGDRGIFQRKQGLGKLRLGTFRKLGKRFGKRGDLGTCFGKHLRHTGSRCKAHIPNTCCRICVLQCVGSRTLFCTLVPCRMRSNIHHTLRKR